MRSWFFPIIIFLIPLFLLITCDRGGGKGSTNDTHNGDASAQKTINLTVNGMTCGSCKSIVEGALEEVDGVITSEVSLPKSVMIIYDTKKTDVAKIKQAIFDAGYAVVD